MGLQKYFYYLQSIIELSRDVRPLSTVWRIFTNRSKPGANHVNHDLTISLPRQKLIFKVRGAMDVWSVKETFLDRFYERYGAPIGAGWIVIDIGGGIGDFTTFAATVDQKNQVYAFEPTPESFGLLQENLVNNQVINAQGFQQAIWSTEGELWMETAIGEPGQFVSYAESSAGSQVPQYSRIQVPAITLSQAFERLAIEQCDLLKMDCEGAEYAILFSAPDDLLSKIHRIVMEYHDNVTEYTHADLVRFLSERNFIVSIHPNVVHNYLGYLYAEQPQIILAP